MSNWWVTGPWGIPIDIANKEGEDSESYGGGMSTPNMVDGKPVPPGHIKVLNKKAGKYVVAPESDLQKYTDHPEIYEVMGPDGRPIRPEATNLLDEQGMIQEKYRLKAEPDLGMASNLDELNARLAGINLDKRGLEALRKRGLTQGPSEWANLMGQKQTLEESGARDRAVAEQAGIQSGQFSELARKGGLSSGARERLAESGGRDLAMARQGVSRQGQLDRLGIAVEDENQRLNILKSLPGMEMQSLEPDFRKTETWGRLADTEAERRMRLDEANRSYRTDIDRMNKLASLGEIGRQDATKMGTYQAAMQEYAANKQADAINAGGKGKK